VSTGVLRSQLQLPPPLPLLLRTLAPPLLPVLPCWLPSVLSSSDLAASYLVPLLLLLLLLLR